MKKSLGFTLIELLVVLVIIGLLIAILLPVIRGAMDRAKTAVCANNLRQIYLGIEMYAQDHNGSWLEPDTPMTPNPGSIRRTAVIWWFTKKVGMGILYDQYIDDLNALYCPVNKDDSEYVRSREDFGKYSAICATNYMTSFYDGVIGSLEQLKYKKIVNDVNKVHINNKKINCLYGDGSVKLE